MTNPKKYVTIEAGAFAGIQTVVEYKMNFLKKAAAAALSAVMLAGMTLPAYAEADGTALIKTGDGSTMLVVDFRK